jgi:hypothetical protein
MLCEKFQARSSREWSDRLMHQPHLWTAVCEIWADVLRQVMGDHVRPSNVCKMELIPSNQDISIEVIQKAIRQMRSLLFPKDMLYHKMWNEAVIVRPMHVHHSLANLSSLRPLVSPISSTNYQRQWFSWQPPLADLISVETIESMTVWGVFAWTGHHHL